MTLTIEDASLLSKVVRALPQGYEAHEVGNSQVVRVNHWNGCETRVVGLIASALDGQCLVSILGVGSVPKPTAEEAVRFAISTFEVRHG